MQAEADRNERLALIGRMTATMAHEIRNALGAVKGYTQWVDEKTALSDPRKRGLSIALRGTERIECLVNELLLFAREETFSTAPVDLPPLLESTVREEAAGWPGQVAVDSLAGVRVLADPDRLRRVLANGVRNAIQAMGGTGVLRVGANPDGKRVRIFIEDSGPGIPETERPRLFTPFHTTKPDGTGLGLAYAKKVVETMKGRIDLRNREDGGGAVFEILLPKG
jgi:signal transduction histidine kinase